MAKVTAPSSMNLARAESIIRSAVPDAVVNFNHVYETGQGETRSGYGNTPLSVMSLPTGIDTSQLKIGVIDTALDLSHPALSDARITTNSFALDRDGNPTSHGTSVISILAGNSADFKGLLPDAHYFAASVFIGSDEIGQSATTFELVKAINWMTEQDVDIVNFSLTGPANPILQEAISDAHESGVLFVAAIGNKGPEAAPLFPAAYDSVVGVTAISKRKQVYRLACRGSHVEFAAPGVLIRHADSNGAYTTSSGTSLAAPFVTAILAVERLQHGGDAENALQRLRQTAEDLGREGFDSTFGFGLIRPLADQP